MYKNSLHDHLREIANTLAILSAQVQELASLYELQKTQGEVSQDVVEQVPLMDLSGSGDSLATVEPKKNGEGVVADENPLERWLTKRGLEILARSRVRPEGDDLDPIVRQMGDHYADMASLRSFLAEIRRKQDSGEEFTLHMRGVRSEEIAKVTHIGTELYRLALLASYDYSKVSKRLRAAPARSGHAINFFTGQWFERYVFLKFNRIMREYNREFHALHGVQVQLPNGSGAELDWLFLPQGETVPIWIEAKTGNYQMHIHKYERMRGMLGLPISRSLLVVLGLDERTVGQLNRLHALTVVNETGLEHLLRDLVQPSNEVVD